MDSQLALDFEVVAAKIQLQELQERLNCALDARTAMALYLGQAEDQQQASNDGRTFGTVSSSLPPADDWQIFHLREQIASLEAFIINNEDLEAANRLQDEEQMNNAAYEASLKLADSLAAQESWEKQIIDHDAAFARKVSRCSSEEWEERGDLLEEPLYLPPKPSSPDSTNNIPAAATGPMIPRTAGVCIRSGTAVVRSSNSSSSLYPGNFHPGATSNSSSSNRAVARAACPEPPFFFTSGVAISSHSYPTSNNAASSSSDAAPAAAKVPSQDPKGKRPMQVPSTDPYNSRGNATGKLSNKQHNGASSSSGNAPEVQCSICFDSFPVNDMISAVIPQHLASSSAAHGRCGHFFCSECMRTYVQEQLKCRKYPIHCPDPSCQEELGRDDVIQLLSKDTRDLQVYDVLVTEHSIEASLKVYCPYKSCSCLLMRPEDDVGQGGQQQDAPFECPSCHRMFCLSCGVAGWHLGMTCQQFQALPLELRSLEDAAMLRMAAAHSWKRCPAPGCGHIVERSEGCNHVRCLCGVDFCYACGKQYLDSTPTPNNVHGTPSCQCTLFTVPEEEPEIQPQLQAPALFLGRAPVPAPAQFPAPIVLRPMRQRPFRGGRVISRTRCWHSASIWDCPNGPNRCWFWHNEDDEPVL